VSAAIVFVGLVIAFISFVAGALAVRLTTRKALIETEARYQALRRDFEVISAVNVRLMGRTVGGDRASATATQEIASERFFDLYDDAKRCLHRALDQHNALAPRPIVISRDGSNLLSVLSEIPEGRFSDDAGEDAGVRSWLRRVFELDAQRRTEGAPPNADDVAALEREREIWSVLSKPRVWEPPARGAHSA
jgi:hypothetical protein